MKKIDWDTLTFDITPAEKMFISHNRDGKWDKGSIVSYGTVPVYPSAVVLNYGQGIFEGMKAYRRKDSSIAMFRPFDNAKRLNSGCKRLHMPPLDERFFVESITNLILENKEYVPPYGKGDLYIRPVLFGSGQMLGVQPANEYTFVIFMSPVGPYFKAGFSGVKIEIRDDFHRAPLYGTGNVKAVGNYATSLYPRSLSKDRGYDEVLYLDARNSLYVEEVGAANFFMLKEGVLSTPKLGGSILPGVTRDSVLTIASKVFGLQIQERDIRYDELFSAYELFCTGTATVLTPILTVGYKDKKYKIGDGKPGKTTKEIYDELKGIQLGDREDRFGWVYKVD
ncbi:MAG: branched-chain amino acid aminotransferase [Spirochaetota bacterium]|nr:MAG: branched-chain amino acid aminotransferase [Spirochaetota bacterium]